MKCILRFGFLFSFIFSFGISSIFAQSSPTFGDSDWHFNLSKTLALELASDAAWQEALIYFEPIAQKSQDWHLKAIHARTQLQLGKVEDAKLTIETALELQPKNPRILLLAGQIASDNKAQEEAIGYLKQCLELQPKNEQAATTLGRMLYQSEAWAELIALYERLISQQSKTGSDVLLRLAKAHENLGNLEQAEFYLKQNLAQHSKPILALTILERFYTKHSETDKATAIQQDIAKARSQSKATRKLRKLAPSSR